MRCSLIPGHPLHVLRNSNIDQRVRQSSDVSGTLRNQTRTVKEIRCLLTGPEYSKKTRGSSVGKRPGDVIRGGRRAFVRLFALMAAAIVAGGGVAGLGFDSRAAAGQDAWELWAGHQVVWGATELPFFGERRTRSETFMLAKVRREGNRLFLTQKACAVRFEKVAGAQVSIDDERIMALPAVDFEFEIDAGVARAAPWKSDWGKADVDEDGKPGMSIHVDAPLCDGVLYVATSTVSSATGRASDDGLAGSIEVQMRQEFLGADSLCLRIFGKDRREEQRGLFAYERVSPFETCESLFEKSWPVRAPRDAPPKKGGP